MIRVAIVEDDAAEQARIREYLAWLSQRENIPLEAEHFASGLAFVMSGMKGFDIVLMDIDMPGMNGMETARALRKVDAAVILIFVTNMAQFAISGYEVDATDFILKPVNKYSFAIKIKRAVARTAKKNDDTLQIKRDGTLYLVPLSSIQYLSIRMIVPSSVTAVNETIDCPEIYTIPDVKSLRDDVNDLKDAAFGSATNPLAYIRRDAGFLSVFHTVGCIGDSLASGACACKESGTVHYIDLYPFSWGQCLARLTGNTYHNFSKGGLSTRSWLTSSYATECFDGNHKCDAYFIGLGQNDKNGSLPVGTAADINLSDYSLNADTYCGNMGRIIQKLQEMQPKAPIFVFIDPNPPQGDTSYNAVICDIVELFSNVWIIDLYTYARDLFTNPANIIGSQYRSGHYSALGYQEIAFVIATYTDWIIRGYRKPCSHGGGGHRRQGRGNGGLEPGGGNHRGRQRHPPACGGNPGQPGHSLWPAGHERRKPDHYLPEDGRRRTFGR